MIQEAILFTRTNAADIAAKLNDYNAEELLEEYNWMLEEHPILVLARDVLDDGWAAISYVVIPQMFERNQPGIKLTTEHFTYVRTI